MSEVRQTDPAAGRAFDPRRLVKPVRRAVYVVVVLLLVLGFSRYSLVTLPAGRPALFEYAASQRVVVEPYAEDRLPRPGDAVLFEKTGGERVLGRVVALAGDRLEIDRGGRRLRRAGARGWFPAPGAVLDRLPLAAGEVLVLAEDPLAGGAGSVLEPGDRAARVVVALPF